MTHKYYKVHLKADSANGVHTRFTIFMNGANCGQLCMREDEAIFFHDLVAQSNWPLKGKDVVITSGHWFKKTEKEKENDEE